MPFVFDPAKDKANIAKHGISLGRAVDFEIVAFREDDRHDYGETRYRAWGLIDGHYHCLVFTHRKAGIRVISLRRAHQKEIDRHVPQARS